MKLKLQIIFLTITFIFVSCLNVYADFDGNGFLITNDANFKNYLIANYDSNHDGEIQESEALAVTFMNASSQNIADLTGIESFIIWLGCTAITTK